MTVVELLGALVQPALLPALPAVSDAIGSTAATAVVYDSRRADARRRVRRAARPERRRREVCAAGRRARRGAGRRGDARTRHPPGRLGRGAGCPTGTGRAGRSIPPAPEWRSPRRGHHGHQREDDDGVSAPLDSRGGGRTVRAARHRGLQRRTARTARPPGPHRKRRTCSRCSTRWWTTVVRRR